VANASFSISINAALQITNTSLPNGNPGVSYNATTLAATGGFTPYSWTITQGALPNGLTLNATSGVISGTPTGAGTSSFTVQVSDSETPAATATTGLSIVINPPPARSAALYTADGGIVFRAGLQIGSDGSLTLLPSSPELALAGSSQFAASPTLPLLFTLGPTLDSLLINPDYSLASYSSAPLPGGSNVPYQPPSVDPTGSNLYLPGTINGSGATGITIFPGNGSFEPLGTVVTPNPPNGRMVFTPDATLAFIPTCSQSDQGSILSFSRSSSGILTPAATYSGAGCGLVAMAVSSDGKYLATNVPVAKRWAEHGLYQFPGFHVGLQFVVSEPFKKVVYFKPLLKPLLFLQPLESALNRSHCCPASAISLSFLILWHSGAETALQCSQALFNV
jgi:hypothetical protein